MDAVIQGVALLAVGFWMVAGLHLARAKKSLAFLADIPLAKDGILPKVSIIIAARNEERKLEQALRSVLGLEYPHLEIFVMNDRSTDGTSEILDRIANQDHRVMIRHLTDLPDGWLGKNYALHAGAREATGEFLLFTDADIVFHPQALRKAIAHVQKSRLDHLTVIPEDTMPEFFLRIVAAAFGIFFFLVFQPWKAKDPRSRKYMGIGAFNLVRASAYAGIGGHRSIAMRPDDDLKLGKLLKQNGYRQDVLIGKGMVTLEWYRSLGELIEGLMKNSFAGVEYRISVVLLVTVGALLGQVWPWIGMVVTTGPAQALYGVAVVLMVVVFWVAMAPYGIKPWHGVLFPIAMLLLLFIQWRAMILTLWSGGITWRGTHYPLRALKANKV